MTKQADKRWLPVVGYEHSYEVSDHGDVRSVTRICTDGREYPGKVLIGRPNARGYLRVVLSRASVRKHVSVHSLVLSAFVSARPIGPEARHLNGIRTDNRLSNLCWGTKLENAADRRVHGTVSEGAKHARAKLSKERAIEVLRRLRNGESQKLLAIEYGVASCTLGHLNHGRTWKFLERKP